MYHKNYIIYLVLLLVILFIVTYSLLAMYVARQARVSTKNKADVILVLGARSYINGKYNPCLVARVEHAVKLYKNNLATKILVSGGNDKEDNVNEAEAMSKIAIAQGVPQSDLLEEKAATSTYENLKFSAEILKKHNLSSVILVTEPFHVARTALVAQKLNYNFSASSVLDSPCWKSDNYFSKYFLKEPLAIMAYKLSGKL